jgi:arginine N-succinyltransferase
MLHTRPVRADDAAALRLLLATQPGADADTVQALVDESLQAQAGDGPVPQRLVFLLEDTAQPAAGPLGVISLAGSTGLDLPRASYRTGSVVHASAELKMFHRAHTLLLGNDLTGCAELGQPVMAAGHRARALQRLLVDAALLFAAAHPDRLAPQLVATLPGIGGRQGDSPFWQGLGRHFHAGELPLDSPWFASPLRSHLARLMPKHPLYSALLGPDAEACIGRHAAPAQALAEALQAQGLRHQGQVDLFDAGPVFETAVADLAAVRGSQRCRVTLQGSGAPGIGSSLVAALGGQAGTGVGLVAGTPSAGRLPLAAADAATLGLDEGQAVLVLPQP